MNTYYSFARLAPGSTALQFGGEYRTRKQAEIRALEVMKSEGRYGGVIVEHTSGFEQSLRVVSVAAVDEFVPFDDEYFGALNWWEQMGETARQGILDRSVDLDGPNHGGVRERAIIYASENYGPERAELTADADMFVQAIVGERLG